jgi:hypothetical protein
VLDLVLPFLLYQALTAAGVTGAPALAASAVLPLASIVAQGVRQHTLDALGLVSVLFILAGIAVGWVSQDPVWALLAGSSFTAVLGLGFLVSLQREHPLAFYLGRQTMTDGSPEAIRRWDASWSEAGFRQGCRVVSAVWGSGLLLEAGVRVLLAHTLTPPTFLLVWPVIGYGVYAALFWWTLCYARR